MRPNDKSVLDFMCLENKDFTPTQVGRKVFKGVNKNVSKLRALRSLNKLLAMGHVARDQRGLYKAKYQRSL